MKPLLALLALSLSTPALALDVLIVHSVPSSTFQDDVAAKLGASGAFTSVSSWNATAATPAAFDLAPFDAVFVYTDQTPLDPVALGDALADYVDAGGAVVDAVFVQDNQYGVTGRYQDSGYGALTGTSTTSGTATLGTFDGVSPLLAGVSTFSGGASSFRTQNAVLTANAVLAASWSDNEPLIAWKDHAGGMTVSLNFYPPSSDIRSGFWDATTDGVAIMVNAITFAAGDVAPDFFRTLSSGTCPGTGTVNVVDGRAGARVAYVSGDPTGSTTVPSGPCAGASIPLASATLRATGTLDSSGARTTAFPLSSRVCGSSFVVVDLGTCAITPVHTLP